MFIQMARRFPNHSSKYSSLKTFGWDVKPLTPGYVPAVINGVKRRAGEISFLCLGG